jgi:small subunit ribosomal protein S3
LSRGDSIEADGDRIVSVVKHFIGDTLKKVQIEEYLQSEFKRAGFGGVDITKTPLGTQMVVYAMRPGLVIGRGGETIKNLTVILEKDLQVPNPQISVAEIEVPEFNAFVMASRIASNLERGIHYRRSCYWALNRIMGAGAIGAEIVVSGKLRTDRHRFEKFRDGYLPKSGDPVLKSVQVAVMHVQLKPGIIGVNVKILPSKENFPDQITFVDEKSDQKSETVEEEIIETDANTENA